MSIIHSAAKGRRKAMEAVSESCQNRVFHVAHCLLLDADLAGSATAAAFKDFWQGLKNKSVPKDETPYQFITIKAAENCRSIISRSNPKAFRMPSGKDFSLPGSMTVSSQHSAEEIYLLTNLPCIQRFVFVLHAIGDLSPIQIGRVLGLDSEIVQNVMAVEESNLKLLQKLSRKQFTSSPEKIVEGISVPKAQLPRKALEQINAGIDHIATPLEQKRRKQFSLASAIAVCACLITAIVVCISLIPNKTPTSSTSNGNSNNTSNNSNNTTQSTTPTYTPPALDEKLTYYANIDIKNYGRITVKLDQKNAPISSANFVKLAKDGFYDGLTFHRIIEGFMMQGGDPQGNGYGGSDNNIVGEFPNNGYDNPLKHTRGAISMARSKDNNSASSQFFIVHEDSSHLDGSYAVFGYVTNGMDIVDKICKNAKPSDNNGTIPAANQPVITSVKIHTA